MALPHHHRTRLCGLLLQLLLVAAPLNYVRAAAARGQQQQQQQQQQDFAVLDNAAILATGGYSSPHERYYLPAIPAFPAPKQPPSNHQRRLLQLQRRQSDGSNSNSEEGDFQAIDCGDDSHNCLDAGPDGAAVCCPDTRYCFVNRDLEVKCCAIGNVCSEQTPCSDAMNYCESFQTVTRTIAPSSSSSSSPNSASASASASDSATTSTNNNDNNDDDEPTPSLLVTISTIAACCNRPCGTESFLCPSAFGAQCCANGARCGTSGNCLSDVTSPAPPVVNPVPSGCSYTWQFACDPRDEGLGCCASGQTCRSPSFCDGEAAAPTATGANGDVITPIDGGDGGGGGGLSSGAKAGVGIGVAVAVLAVITAVVAFCLRRSNKRNNIGATTGGRDGVSTLLSDDQPNNAGNQRYRMNTVGGGGGGGGGGASGGSGGGSGSYGGRMRDRIMGPMSPGAQFFRRAVVGGTAADSEMSGPTSVGGSYGNAGGGGPGSNGGGGGGGTMRPQPHQTGLPYDYFGPEAVTGPYTVDASTPAASPPERDGGTSVHPHGPHDIMIPVELDSSRVVSSAAAGDEKNKKNNNNNNNKKKGAAEKAENTYGRFELVGSPPLPTAASPSPPLSNEEEGEPRSLGTLSPSPEPSRSLH